MDQVYSPIYDSNANSPAGDPLLSHRLSLLFMVLAIGSLVDTRIPAYNLEAEKYHQLARAALFRNGLFDEPSNHVVQALVSISINPESMGLLTSKGIMYSILCQFIFFWPTGMGEGPGHGGLSWAWQ
jgi:hypothetical protein